MFSLVTSLTTGAFFFSVKQVALSLRRQSVLRLSDLHILTLLKAPKPSYNEIYEHACISCVHWRNQVLIKLIRHRTVDSRYHQIKDSVIFGWLATDFFLFISYYLSTISCLFILSKQRYPRYKVVHWNYGMCNQLSNNPCIILLTCQLRKAQWLVTVRTHWRAFTTPLLIALLKTLR